MNYNNVNISTTTPKEPQKFINKELKWIHQELTNLQLRWLDEQEVPSRFGAHRPGEPNWHSQKTAPLAVGSGHAP